MPVEHPTQRLVTAILLHVSLLATAAQAAEPVLAPDLADCGGFQATDAAPLLDAPPAQVTRHVETLPNKQVLCSYAAGNAARQIAFSIAVAPSAEQAASDLEDYRDNLALAAEAVPWKDKLPDGAYSEIEGPGLGDENLWTDINGALTVRKANVTLQFTSPPDKRAQLRAAQAVLAQF